MSLIARLILVQIFSHMAHFSWISRWGSWAIFPNTRPISLCDQGCFTLAPGCHAPRHLDPVELHWYSQYFPRIGVLSHTTSPYPCMSLVAWGCLLEAWLSLQWIGSIHLWTCCRPPWIFSVATPHPVWCPDSISPSGSNVLVPSGWWPTPFHPI